MTAEHNIIVGGSYISLEDHNAFILFENENGNVIARRDFSEGEGVVVADMV